MVHQDRYLYFEFNGIHSSDLGVFYINKGEDISFPFTSNATRRFSTPLYQNVSYNLGKDEGQRTYTLQLAAADRNLNDIQDILDWLNVGDLGNLVFDFRPDYSYKVYVNKIKPPVIIPFEFPNNIIKHVVMLDVEFVTHGDNFVETRNSYLIPNINSPTVETLHEPDELLPIFKKSGGKNYIINWSGVDQFIDVKATSNSIKVSSKTKGISTNYYEYSFPSILSLNLKTDLGVVLVNGKLAEKSYNDSLIKNVGPMPIKSGIVFRGLTKIQNSSGNLKITLDRRFKNISTSDKIFVYIEEEASKEDILEQNKDGRYWFKGYYKHSLNQEGMKVLKLPEVKEAVVNSSMTDLTFSNAGLNLKTGVYKVKIAVGEELEIVTPGSGASVEFTYKKGV